MAETQSAHSIAYSRAPFSTWLGIVCLFVLFGLIVLAVIGPSPRTSDYEETRAKKRMEKLKTLHEESQKELTTYAWVDKNKGVARIPIDRAMEVTVADLAQKKPAPAGPIATLRQRKQRRRPGAAHRSGRLASRQRRGAAGSSRVRLPDLPPDKAPRRLLQQLNNHHRHPLLPHQPLRHEYVELQPFDASTLQASE